MTDPRKPVRVEEDADDQTPRELPRHEDENEMGRKHFPRPGRDTVIPNLPDGQTDAPPA